MAIKIFMPKLGWTMEEGVLDEWVKQDGEEVQAGDIIFVVESDKALQEIEAFDSGILRILPDAPPLGSTVKIGELLAYLVEPGETPPFELNEAGEAPAKAMSTQSTEAPASASHAVDEDERRPSRSGGPKASPRAKRIAAELNIDWMTLTGSGSGGRIVERDVRAAAETVAARRETAPVDTRTAMTSVRRVTRDHMVESARTAAPVTLTSEADATELVQMRRKLMGDGAEIVPTYTDLVATLVARALREHPALNASIEGDDVILHGTINIAVAVDSERGLFAPVIQYADKLSLLELTTASVELVKRARQGKLKPEQLQGATFTISNLGMYDIDAFTPIISLPQVAVLGIGRIVARQIVMDAEAERSAIRHMMSLSLTFDHRAVDGAPAARFLQRVKQYVETPYLWLVN